MIARMIGHTRRWREMGNGCCEAVGLRFNNVGDAEKSGRRLDMAGYVSVGMAERWSWWK